MLSDESVLQLIYQQAVSDVIQKRIHPEEEDAQLRMLKAQKKLREVNPHARPIFTV